MCCCAPRGGGLSKVGRGAYVPLKYCQAIDSETIAAIAAERKVVMKRKRERSRAAEEAFIKRMQEQERA